MWIAGVLSITSYLISLVQSYMAMLVAKRTLKKYSQWIPQQLVNIYNSLHIMQDQIYFTSR